MLTRILNSRLPLMIYNPAKVFSKLFFTRAFQAGALPVFDTEFLNTKTIKTRIDELADLGILFGLRLTGRDPDLMRHLKKTAPRGLDLMVLPLEKGDEAVTDLPGVRLFLEVREIDCLNAINDIDPHGLVLRGNEAGGMASTYSSFILMQWYLKNSTLPLFIHGGVGRHTAAGMFAAGVSGMVLDSQIWLSDESPLSDNFKKLLNTVEEGDSIEITTDSETIFRVFAKLGTKAARDLKEEALILGGDENARETIYNKIKDSLVSMDDPEAAAVQSLFFLGQDAVFAKDFAADATDLKSIINTFFIHIGKMLDLVDLHDPVQKNSPLAREHGTIFPLIQGPMANVSDNVDFALKVLEAGALPFFAVGSLPEFLAAPMLRDAAEKVKTFGAGLVGIEAFNPAIAAHMELVKETKAPFALFAGGIPSQITELEEAGTKAYLHTPSVSMMENAQQSGCSRFIFEGKEAGGHIGSLSSLVLWESAITRLLKGDDPDLTGKSLIFAGGISTRFASYFISGLTSLLASKGAKIGLQVGSAYLFAREIVEAGCIKEQYQSIISEENKTMVIGTSVGLASRTAPTDFARMMIETEQEMVKTKAPLKERKHTFEKKNIGSLLIGAKGFLPDFKKPGKENYTYFEGEDHKNKGNFLVGESLAFWSGPTDIKKIHGSYFDHKDLLFRNLGALEIFSSEKNRIRDEIAIVGMGCILPGSSNPEELWENVLNKHYSIHEMPEERLDRELYYDADKSAEDKTYTILAATVDDFSFDEERFGYTGDKAARLSRSQKMLLTAAYQAVENAGYLGEDMTFACKDPEKTAVIVATCLGNELGNDIQLKYHFPEITAMLKKTEAFNEITKEEQEKLLAALETGLAGNNQGYDPVHGMLLNIEASRVARHLGIRGPNYVVDAACASSFTAMESAMGELLSGEADQVVVGGVNTHLAPESFIGFSKMGALSAEGSFPFDERADGFILGEGAAVFVLKRVKDAIRDGDTILSVIKGLGSSSDGKGKAIAAPNPDGQILALERCFENMDARLSPGDIGYIEAHGTSTIMGDQAELVTLKHFYEGTHAGISSVKSQIGHLLGGAGAAGLLTAALAVKNGKLPPNATFETLSPNHNMDDTDLFIIKEPREWESDGARRAGISAYGFGGINYHMVIEEFTRAYRPLTRSIFEDPEYDFNDDRIVIAGLGLRLPGTPDQETFWKHLESGEKQLSSIPGERFSNQAYAELPKNSFYRLPLVKAGVIRDFKFNNIKYRIPPTTVRSIERGQLLGLDAASEAIETSGLDKLIRKGNRIGTVLGTIPGERQTKNILRVRKELVARIIRETDQLPESSLNDIADQLVEDIRKRLPENNEDTTPGLLSNIISGRIANFFGLNGANYVVDASCASGVIAIRNAARSIAFKEMDFALAGGVDANLYPAVLMAFKRLGLLSENDCNFFDSRADGYVMGEGAAVHLITTLKKARESGMDVLGEINSFAVKSSVPEHLLAPSEPTFVSTINQAYRQCGVKKREINHLDLFAFSNILGDMIEKQVTDKVFHHKLACGNTKPQFGYFKAANPAVVMAKLMLMNKNRKLLPNFNFDPEYSTMTNSPVLVPLAKAKRLAPGMPMRMGMNVNGIGGNHCHIILGTLPPHLQEETKKPETEIPKTVHAQASSSIVPEKAARAQARVHSPAPMTATLNPAYSADHKGIKQRMVALLSGQGAQRPGMMKALFDDDPEIRRIMETGEEIFKEIRGYSLLDMMFREDDRLNLTENTQPAVFLSTAAIFTRLNSHGFNPDLFIGHSVGEYTALFCSGMLDFDPAWRLLIKRADLMKEAARANPGKIMVVFRNEKETGELIRASALSGIYITNKNSENQTAVSGDRDAIKEFCTFLTGNNVIYRKLNLSGAFHTPLFNEAARKLREYLAGITFNEVKFGRVISNVTAAPYPENRRQVKDLLAKQITSPVEFIRSVEGVYVSGRTHYIEIGPGRLLSNLLKNINIAEYKNAVTVDAKKGELASFEECKEYLKSFNSLFTKKRETPVPRPPMKAKKAKQAKIAMDDDFAAFKAKNRDLTERLLYEEFTKQRREAAMEAVERFGFDTEKIVISGVSVGLPGKARKVFAQDNFDKIIQGTNFIEPLERDDQLRITDKNITRLLKDPDGNARFVEITRTEDVIHLAGQLGYFNLTEDYGIKEEYDISMGLAVAAGIEALKDAGIPLVMQYKKTGSRGNMIPAGFALPEDMQEETGVIITSLFPSQETLVNEMEKYLYHRLYLEPYEEFENIYYYLMESVKDMTIKEKITDWFFKIKKKKREDLGPYKFDRNIISSLCPLGAAHLAQIIRAKGPNTLVSCACASTTQAVGIAEDWIRTSRCKRVLVIGGENATSRAQNQWIGSGFLALGAATVKKRVSEAAKPFDEERNGTILGSGAVGLVIEKESKARARGMKGQVELLGTHMANSAYHTYNIDVPHLAKEMEKFINKMEKRHGLEKSDYAKKLLFMSHETYTPARGGSADAEVTALKSAFSGYLNHICISNTKGFTGHTLGAAIEDVVMVKALQRRQAPPIANLKNIPAHFQELNFSGSGQIDAEYGLHLAAGFGSHLAFILVKRIEENSFENNPAYLKWLKMVSGTSRPQLKIIDNTLCIVADPDAPEIHTPSLPAAMTAAQGPAPGIQAPESPRENLKNEFKEAPKTNLTDPAPAVPAPGAEAPDSASILEKLKAIIADQTGYTPDMLEPDLDLEADLGIDTVKQVEIFAKAATMFGFAVPEDLKLRDLNTIAKLADYVAEKTPEAASPDGGSAPSMDTAPMDDAQDAPAQAPGPAGADSASILEKLKAIIADQTGYTPDMLEPDLDLEADLGIDTVKQVEIFAKAAAMFGFAVPEDLKLRDLNTIAKLAAHVESRTGGGDDTPPAPSGGGDKPKSTRASKDEGNKSDSGIRRLVPSLTHAMLPDREAFDLTGKTILLTLDSMGFAEKVAKRLKKAERIIGITHKKMEAPYCSDLVMMDFSNEASTRKSMKNLIAEHPGVDGIIHLAPLDLFFSRNGEMEAQSERAVTTLFLILQELFNPLNKKGSLIGTISLDSVLAPFGDGSARIEPAFSGISGMLKSLAKEMPETRVKVVDVSIDSPLEKRGEVTDLFMNELLGDDETVETLYRNGQKQILGLVEQEIDKSGTPLINTGETLLVSGGARGITYEILKNLAARYRTNLIIMSRSPIDGVEPALLALAENETALMGRLRKTMEGAKPVALKKEARRLMGIRETLANLERLKKSGVSVTYLSADVADKTAVENALKEIKRVDGIIHAAGIEESMPFDKKSYDSFLRVFNTKVKGSRNLIHATAGKNVRFHIGFSSVTARFGNEGQADYTAANDMLAKILMKETAVDRNTRCKILDWTAWSGAGMATRETVQKVLTQRGIRFLPLDEGIKFFMDEMEDDTTQEVVISGKDHAFDRDGLFSVSPLLDQKLLREENSTLFSRTLDPSRDRFLLDHAMEGTPIFLGATGVETLSEAAIKASGRAMHVVEVSNFSIPYGIKILKNRPKDLTIEAKKAGENHFDCTITSQFVSPRGVIQGAPKLHYQGSVHLAEDAPGPVKREIPAFTPVEDSKQLAGLIYHPQRLFMDELFKTIRDILSFDGKTLVTLISDESRARYFTGRPHQNFATDVALLDAMFQTGGVFEFFTDSNLILPYRIKSLKIFQRGIKDVEYYCFTTRTASTDETDTFQIDLTDKQGRMVMGLTDFEMVKVHKLSLENRIDQSLKKTGETAATAKKETHSADA